MKKRLTDYPELYSYMRPYQRIGVRKIDERNGRVLLADQMGLGKTIQAIAYLLLNPDLRPSLIISPAVAKHHWKNTALKWLLDDTVRVISGRTPEKLNKESIHIINYELLSNEKITASGNFCLTRFPDIKPFKVDNPKQYDLPFTGWIDYLIDLNPVSIIADEIHKTKHSSANRTQAMKALIKNTDNECFIPISGTPIDNCPAEFYNVLSWVEPSLFPNEWDYRMRYCNPKHNGFGWSFKGASHTKELHSIIEDSGVMIRRRKKDVLKDLPPKTRTIIPLPVTNKQEYERANRNLQIYLQNTRGTTIPKSSEGFAKIEILRQVIIKGKMKAAINWIEDFLDSGEKLVLFVVHKKVVSELTERFKRVSVKVVGGMTSEQKERAEYEFQNNDSIRLFIGNIEAAGVSLTLTAASCVAFLEMPDTPTELEQCEERVYGRINDPHGANIYFLVALDTKEEDIAEMIDRKAKIISETIDGEEITAEEMLSELIKKWRNEN